MTRRQVTIGLLWHSAMSDNLGVGALTVAHIAMIEGLCARLGLPVRFLIIGWADPGKPYVGGDNVEIVGLRTRDLVRPSGLSAAVRRCDLVLDIGAGDSFADIYGAKRFLKMLLSKRVVLSSGRPLVLSPQTIGPFGRWWARPLALSAIRRARAVSTRDALSTRFVRELGFSGPLQEATDVALRLPYDPPPTDRAENGRPIRVGVNPSGLLFNGGYTRANQFGLAAPYPELMRRLIGTFAARPDCEVHLVGHVNSDVHAVEDDHRVAAQLAGEFPGVVLAPRFAGPSEAKSYIAGLDFFTGSRMHACIAAFSSGVPVVPLAYSRKFAGLFGTLGYDFTADCRTEDADAIMARIEAGFADRAGLRQRIDASMAEAGRRLDAYLETLAEILTAAVEARA